MAEPTYGTATEALYARLPMCHREEDPLSRPEFALKKFLSVTGDALSDVVDLLASIDYYTPDEQPETGEDTSALVDPALADPAWLPWLGQFVGVDVDEALPVADQRFQISSAASGFRAGTKSAVADAVRLVLTGTKYVEVFDHQIDYLDVSVSTDTPSLESGGQWDLLIRTKASETPSPHRETVLAAAAAAAPAGVRLWYREWSVSWASIEAERPTWVDWNGATWAQIQEGAALPVALIDGGSAGASPVDVIDGGDATSVGSSVVDGGGA